MYNLILKKAQSCRVPLFPQKLYLLIRYVNSLNYDTFVVSATILTDFRNQLIIHTFIIQLYSFNQKLIENIIFIKDNFTELFKMVYRKEIELVVELQFLNEYLLMNTQVLQIF